MRRIYLVDDDPVFVFLVTKIIETVDSALRIEAFADGELAINRIESIQADPAMLPDLIFLDLNMPVMDGWGFLDRYTAIHEKFGKAISLYILSSTISPGDIEHAEKYPVILDFLIKPLEPAKAKEILSS